MEKEIKAIDLLKYWNEFYNEDHSTEDDDECEECGCYQTHRLGCSEYSFDGDEFEAD